MNVPYTRLPHGFKRPIIRIALSRNGKQVPYFALIDSGADMNLMHAELAPLLGLDLEAGERREVGGIVDGARRPFYVHKVTLHVGNRSILALKLALCRLSPRPATGCSGNTAFSTYTP